MSRRECLTRERALAIFLASRQRRSYAESTVRLERQTLCAFLARLDVPLAQLNREHVRRFVATRSPEVCGNTLARELATLRAFFGCLVDEGHLPTNPAATFRARYCPAAPPLILSPVSVARLFDASTAEPACRRGPHVRRALALRNRALLELLYGLGLRASEVHGALLIDFHLKEGRAFVRRVKRGESRVLPLPAKALPHLARYLAEGRPLLVRGADSGHFLLTERGTPLTPKHLYRLVVKIARRAGLRAHPHALRRAVATHLVRDGGSVVAAQQLLGHARLDTTQRYVATDRDELRRAVEVLEPMLARANASDPQH